MSLPALQMDESPSPQTGVARAARLMRLLGPAAAGVWNELSAGETAHLRRAMTAGEIQPTDEDAALFISELERPEPYAPPEEQSVWQRLSDCEPDAIAASIAPEHPQTIALILSRMNAAHAALTVRALPRDIAVSALRRLLHAGRPDSESLALIEDALGRQIDAGLSGPASEGPRKIASIFDRLGAGLEKPMLSSLEESDPGAGERIRALMFTFDDLASMDAAAMQTILSQTDRATLATALKGASKPVLDIFLRNVTRRAGELLVSEIEAMGPVRRSRVEAARAEITDIARHLARKGEILTHDDIEDELIE